MDLHVSMIINNKKKKKKGGKLVKEILELIEQNKAKVNIDNSFEKELDIFVLSYLKLTKLIDISRDTIDNIEASKDIIDGIITKVEDNDFIIPELNKKKIFIKEEFIKHSKQTDIKIEMV
tara:strand:+ start:533 stop:892 length:360 start_codon:yes stop_codon:yes gene_type:complete